MIALSLAEHDVQPPHSPPQGHARPLHGFLLRHLYAGYRMCKLNSSMHTRCARNGPYVRDELRTRELMICPCCLLSSSMASETCMHHNGSLDICACGHVGRNAGPVLSTTGICADLLNPPNMGPQQVDLRVEVEPLVYVNLHLVRRCRLGPSAVPLPAGTHVQHKFSCTETAVPMHEHKITKYLGLAPPFHAIPVHRCLNLRRSRKLVVRVWYSTRLPEDPTLC